MPFDPLNNVYDGVQLITSEVVPKSGHWKQEPPNCYPGFCDKIGICNQCILGALPFDELETNEVKSNGYSFLAKQDCPACSGGLCEHLPSQNCAFDAINGNIKPGDDCEGESVT